VAHLLLMPPFIYLINVINSLMLNCSPAVKHVNSVLLGVEMHAERIEAAQMGLDILRAEVSSVLSRGKRLQLLGGVLMFEGNNNIFMFDNFAHCEDVCAGTYA